MSNRVEMPLSGHEDVTQQEEMIAAAQALLAETIKSKPVIANSLLKPDESGSPRVIVAQYIDGLPGGLAEQTAWQLAETTPDDTALYGEVSPAFLTPETIQELIRHGALLFPMTIGKSQNSLSNPWVLKSDTNAVAMLRGLEDARRKMLGEDLLPDAGSGVLEDRLPPSTISG